MNRSSADTLTMKAPAKINLYLHVTGKRADGYHLLDSMVVFASDVADRLTFEKSDGFALVICGPFQGCLMEEDLSTNLVVRAARAFSALTGIPLDCKITLEKNIPLGAGLGGGSSDAAVTIKGLEKLYGRVLPEQDRRDLLLKLGADVPVCYESRPCRFQGIGDVITGVPPLPVFHMLLIWPNVHSATRDVFAKRDGAFTPLVSEFPQSFEDLQDLLGFLKTTDNDLTEAAERLSPKIRDAQNFMAAQKGCLLSRMSGSGACVLGIFEDSRLCTEAKDNCNAQNPEWWAQTTIQSDDAL